MDENDLDSRIADAKATEGKDLSTEKEELRVGNEEGMPVEGLRAIDDDDVRRAGC